jgi:hypothetical protein
VQKIALCVLIPVIHFVFFFYFASFCGVRETSKAVAAPLPLSSQLYTLKMLLCLPMLLQPTLNERLDVCCAKNNLLLDGLHLPPLSSISDILTQAYACKIIARRL